MLLPLKSLPNLIPDFLRKRNIEGLLFCAAQFDSYRGLPIQTLLCHEFEIIDSSSAIKSKHTKPMPVVYESSIDRNVEHIVSHTAAQAQQIPESESNSGTKMPAEEDDDSSSVTSSSSEGESSDSDEEDENTVLITPSTLPPLAAPIAVTMADGLDIAVKELVVPISVAATSAATPAVDNMDGSEYETESEGSEEDSSDEEAEVKAVGKADPLNTTAAPILIIASDAPSAIATTAVPSDAATATAASVIAAPIAPVAVTIAADANITVVAPEANIAATDSDAEDDYYRTDVINYDDNDSEDAKDSDDGEESYNKTPPIPPKPTVITKVAKVTTNARTETAVSKTSSYDADTSSSSSGEEEDENEEGTASEDEEVKKPPLALLVSRALMNPIL